MPAIATQLGRDEGEKSTGRDERFEPPTPTPPCLIATRLATSRIQWSGAL